MHDVSEGEEMTGETIKDEIDRIMRSAIEKTQSIIAEDMAAQVGRSGCGFDPEYYGIPRREEKTRGKK